MAQPWTQMVCGVSTDYTSEDGSIKLFTLKNTRFGGEVLVKQILCANSEIAARRMGEGQIAQDHAHPNTVEILEYVQEPAPNGLYVYVIMRKYASDLDKDATHRRSQAPVRYYDEPRIWRMLKGIVSALCLLQKRVVLIQGFAHRDIKPANLLMDASGNVKICDFGFARKISQDAVQMFTLAGTVPFFSPALRRAYIQGDDELRRVQHDVFKSDVYSLGVTFMYLTILEVPGFVSNLRDLQRNIENRITEINNYSETWKQMLRRMLEVNEDARPDFLQLEAELNNAAIPVCVEPIPEKRVFSDDARVEVPPMPQFSEDPLQISIRCGYSVVGVCTTKQSEVPCVVTLKATSLPARQGRCNADVVCVIDVSGSMAGAKIQRVKNTLNRLVQVLGKSDRVSIVAFNDTADRKCPLIACDPAGQQTLRRTIEGLAATGRTNIAAGLTTGIQVIAERVCMNHVAAIFFFSDGEDDRGTDPVKVCAEAVCNLHSDQSLSVHTFGYGNDIDINLLTKLAAEGKGQFHHILDECQMQDAFAVTLGTIVTAMARNVRVSLTANCLPVRCQISKVFSRDGQEHFWLPLMTADQTKDLVFLMKTPLQALDRTTNASPVSAKVEYVDNEDCETSRSLPLEVRFVPFEDARDAVRDQEVFANYYRVKGADFLKSAKKRADTGDFQGAYQQLSNGVEDLGSSDHQGHPLVAAVIHDLETAMNIMSDQGLWKREGDARFTSIAYSHYTQTAAVGTLQYATPQQEEFRRNFTDRRE